jgi:hypothetical protein
MDRWLVSPETVPPYIHPEMMTWREKITSLPRSNTDSNQWFLASFWFSESGLPDLEKPFLNQIVVRNFPINAYKPISFGGYKWITIDFEVPQIESTHEFRKHGAFKNADVICLNQQYKIISQSSVESLDINRLVVEGE